MGQSAFGTTLSIVLIFIVLQYALLDLKEACEIILANTLTTESLANHLALADMYSAETLKEGCLKFFACHAMHVIPTEGWQILARTEPRLMTDALKQLAKKAKNSTVGSLITTRVDLPLPRND